MSDVQLTTRAVRWVCACCWNPFTPNEDQTQIKKTVGLKLCVPCIAAVDAEIDRINKLKEQEEA